MNSQRKVLSLHLLVVISSSSAPACIRNEVKGPSTISADARRSEVSGEGEQTRTLAYVLAPSANGILPFPDWAQCRGKGVFENYRAGVKILDVFLDGRRMASERVDAFDLWESEKLQVDAPFIYLVDSKDIVTFDPPRRFLLPFAAKGVIAATTLEIEYQVRCADGSTSARMSTKGRWVLH